MKKSSFILPLLLAITLTACGSRPTSRASNFGSATQNGATAGQLSATMQIALGTLKLDGTKNEVTADQATQLIPLWETLQQMETSDTAAQQETEALDAQIKETMTQDQMQAITAMNLTRQDMFSVLQAQGGGFGTNGQNNTQQSGTSSGNRNFPQGGFGPGAGGPPPEDRVFTGGGQGFGGQSQNRSAAQIATAQAARQAGGGNRIPAPLLNAVIEFLKKKAGS